jgi:hypothetical protein
MEISIDYDSFAPIMDLPPPPKEMIEEAEKEEAIYMREMLDQVLTIREAKCIKLALWEKLHRHPIVQGIYDLCDERREFMKDSTRSRDPAWVHHIKTYYRNDNPYYLKEVFKNQKCLITSRLGSRFRGKSQHPLLTFREENCKYLRGKNQGKVNEKWWELAHDIYEKWVDAIKEGVIENKATGFSYPNGYRSFTAEELYRLGFWEFMLYNHKKNRNKAKWEWSIEMP